MHRDKHSELNWKQPVATKTAERLSSNFSRSQITFLSNIYSTGKTQMACSYCFLLKTFKIARRRKYRKKKTL